jgi:sigma-B regulation protein RsbQ
MQLNPLLKNNVTVINGDEYTDTIVFAHGFGSDQHAWKEVIASFPDQYRMVLYDNTGGGKADPSAFSPNKYDNLHSYADDLIDICEALNIGNAILVAHSVSGMIGTLAAIREPQRFRKMVLVGASPRYLNDEGYHGGFTHDELDTLFSAMANNYFAWVSGFSAAAMSNPERPELARDFASSLSAIRPDIAQSVARVIFQSDYRQVLPQLNTETLLLQTKEDIAVPMEVAEYLNEHIANSRLEVVDARGHFPHISAAGAVSEAIKNFI